MAATALFAPVWSMFLIGGLAGLPLSVPPLDEDPALGHAAPQQCLWYMSAAGTADPDANSTNHTEQLLADPQIQQLCAEIESEILRFVRRHADGGEERVLATELPELIKIALTHPLAAYVADFLPPSDTGPPAIQAGLVVKLGERAGEVERSLLRLTMLATDGSTRGTPASAGAWHDLPLPSDAPPMRWGIQDGFLILGIGEGESERIASRLSTGSGPPEWLDTVKNELPVERRSTLGYLNIAGILERVTPLLGAEEAQIPSALGLDNVQALYTTSGMDATACVTKGHMALDGPPHGALALLPHKPLAKRDLALVPKDAIAAFALRLDVKETLDRFVDLVATLEPRAREEFEEGLWEAETELGIDIRNDILGSLDDTLVVYMPGGEIFTAWTGTSAVVKIKDRRRLERAIDKLTFVARTELEPRGSGRDGVRLRESEFGDYTLHYIQFVGQPMPFTPAWCVTDDILVAGLTPQSVKGAISRYSESGDSLADIEPVSHALSTDYGPAMLSYVDVQKLFRGLYPMMMWGLQAAAGEMAREGFELDLAVIPAVDAIAPHLVPSVSTWTHAPDGFRFEAHQSLPGGDIISTAPISAALVLPWLAGSRRITREVQEMNNLKQLALAFHNYADTYARFPTNIYGPDGEALLSWRVELLPYIEQPQLYEQFRRDEPWDSPHNRRLIEQMPAVFQSPSVPQTPGPAGRTRYVVLVHEDSLFPGNEKLDFASVTDGTSNTIMIVQAGPQAAVEWTKPDDIPFDPNDPKAGLIQPSGHFLAAFADGSVHRIFLGIGDGTVQRLVFRNDGQHIDRDELHSGAHR